LHKLSSKLLDIIILGSSLAMYEPTLLFWKSDDI